MASRTQPQLCDLARQTCVTYKNSGDEFARRLPAVAKLSENAYRDMTQRLIRARRYVLSDDLTDLAAEISVRPPEYFLARLADCRLPFPQTWFEWDENVRLAAFRRLGLVEGDIDEDKQFSGHAGCLIEQVEGHETRFRMGSVTGYLPDPSSGVAFYPFGFVYDLEGVPEPLTQDDVNISTTLSGMEGRMDERFALGKTYSRRAVETGSERAATALADHCHYGFWGPQGVMFREMMRLEAAKTDNPLNFMGNLQLRERLVMAASAISGDWLFALAILTLLNTVAREIDSDRIVTPREKRMVKGRIIPCFEYRRVELRLPKEQVYRSVVPPDREGRPKRRHEVEATWCYRRGSGDPKCPHTHYRHIEDTHRYECTACGRVRWRRKSFERGDASIGFVRKEYVLTTDGRQKRRSVRVDAAPPTIREETS